ncbi:MAG: LysR family transcriptional regulator [Clostridium argentinense]|uniref:LysR family transcriptional regulator n=1 Tax=Clostridium faecium TaxID=2762223 RepID=A0ABR8YQ13_9CLOT|nr:LysR family transcriptional regulator [Clostridium faecium]MBD8046296.1 LysR family transcriptional regulator [Clostridium faecium]MBS5824642.1 LysR family transcriptional regulator [Clostridium argentinense]MDU1349475.1 LysR family transcriptional regulator [Clostridium argentinense]
MEFRNIATFLRVAATRNFSKAAEQLGYSQSTVTIQIQQLEKELGTQLFERIGKQVNLTNQGEAFILHANEIMRVTNAAMNFAVNADVPTGSLRIGGVESLCTAILPELLLQFHHLCPQVETVIRTATTDELIDMIKCNDIDIMFTLDKKVYGSEWVRAVQKDEDIVFVTSSRHSLIDGQKIELQTIIKEPFILTEKGGSYRYELERMLAAKEMEIRPVLEIGNTETIIHLLEEGVGVSFLPLFSVKKAIKQGTLSRIQTDIPTIQMCSQLLYHKNKWVTPQMQAFIEIVQNFYKRE